MKSKLVIGLVLILCSYKDVWATSRCDSVFSSKPGVKSTDQDISKDFLDRLIVETYNIKFYIKPEITTEKPTALSYLKLETNVRVHLLQALFDGRGQTTLNPVKETRKYLLDHRRGVFKERRLLRSTRDEEAYLEEFVLKLHDEIKNKAENKLGVLIQDLVRVLFRKVEFDTKINVLKMIFKFSPSTYPLQKEFVKLIYEVVNTPERATEVLDLMKMSRDPLIESYLDFEVSSRDMKKDENEKFYNILTVAMRLRQSQDLEHSFDPNEFKDFLSEYKIQEIIKMLGNP